MRQGPEPAISTCLSSFPQDQSEDGTNRFMRVQRVKKLMRHLKPLDLTHNSDSTKHAIYWQLTTKLSTKRLAKLARDRILEKQKGADWPPFAVSFVSPATVHSMEQPDVERTPGASV
jgi:hypothetical protein